MEIKTTYQKIGKKKDKCTSCDVEINDGDAVVGTMVDQVFKSKGIKKIKRVTLIRHQQCPVETLLSMQ